MALARVQATGRVSAAATTSVSLTFATPPTVGNAIIVLAARYQPAGATISCADNRGNPYTLAVTVGPNPMGAAIFSCAALTASAAPFTVTLTFSGGSTGYWETAALEVSGVGTGLTVDQSVSQSATSATPSTGTTPALTVNEVLLAAVHAIGANQASLVVQTVSPAWTEEFENLNYSATVAGEGDTRIVTGATGTTQTCSWTAATAATWGAALAAFKAGVPATVPLTASSALSVATTATLMLLPFPVAASSTVSLGTTATLTLLPFPLAAASGVSLGTTATLLLPPVPVAASSGVRVGTLATLGVVFQPSWAVRANAAVGWTIQPE
jgi:hypothetical protein